MVHTSTGPVSIEKTREAIGRALLQQYEQWQPRVRYKTLIDPTVEEFRKLCISLRKSARQERVLMHYNGHGVPRPTRNGEFWVFNKQFTQYIPVNIADAAEWLGLPAIWVLDCPGAAYLLQTLQRAAETISAMKSESALSSGLTEATSQSYSNTYSESVSSIPPSGRFDLIAFAACESQETLPLPAAMPADILTSCLTTPLDMAIRWHCFIGGSLLPSIDVRTALCIPGRMNDRRTPLGELNWIFTAITDTIAWLVLPRDTFRRLYRQDLLIASLSRNYLLAQRILKSLYCHSSSVPAIPATHQHPFWTLWDHVLDSFVNQLTQSTNFQPSSFFTDQLGALELWLRQHRSTPAPLINGPPDQLPSALQILLSQNLRPRALSLLAQFCDFGAWACLECLHVGIHPYILKLLQTGAAQPLASPAVAGPLCHIWARLLAVDQGCRSDLMKEASYRYFANCLDNSQGNWILCAAAALCSFAHEHESGRDALLGLDMIHRFLNHRNFTQSEGLKWRLMLLAELWTGSLSSTPEVIHRLLGLGAKDLPTLLSPLLRSAQVAIRSAAVYALGTLFSINKSMFKTDESSSDSLIDISGVQTDLLALLLERVHDLSPAVRLEVVISLSKYISSGGEFTAQESLSLLISDPIEAISRKATQIANHLTYPNSDVSTNGTSQSSSSSSDNQVAFPLASNLLEYFLRHELDDFLVLDCVAKDLNFAPEVRYSSRLSAKAAAFYNLELELWRDRPLSTRKLDSQVTVIDLDADIERILFHPLLPQIYAVDDGGTLT